MICHILQIVAFMDRSKLFKHSYSCPVNNTLFLFLFQLLHRLIKLQTPVYLSTSFYVSYAFFLFLDPFLFSDLSLFLSNFFISREIFYCKQTTSCTINVKRSKELQVSNIMYKKTMTFCLSLIRENWTNHFYLQAGNKGNILPTPKKNYLKFDRLTVNVLSASW